MKSQYDVFIITRITSADIACLTIRFGMYAVLVENAPRDVKNTSRPFYYTVIFFLQI